MTWLERADEIYRRDGFLNDSNLAETGPMPGRDRDKYGDGLAGVARLEPGAWENATPPTKAAASTAKPKGTKSMTPNESQGVIEAFTRLVAVTRTKYPRMTRQRAAAFTAQQHPGVHEQYLKALTGRAGVDRPRMK